MRNAGLTSWSSENAEGKQYIGDWSARDWDDFFKGISDLSGASEFYRGENFADSGEICNLQAYEAGVYTGSFIDAFNAYRAITKTKYLFERIVDHGVEQIFKGVAEETLGLSDDLVENNLQNALREGGSFMPTHPDARRE
jgi:hypothetical protein